MGMDVYGKNPRSEAGKYFRASMWSWPQIWGYCTEIAPEYTSQVKYGWSNDGDGLPSGMAAQLGVKLQAHIATGHCERTIEAMQAKYRATPDEECTICGGTGKRAQPPICGPGELPCNGCNSQGKHRPHRGNVYIDLDHMQEFATFLRECGGFEIW